MNAEQVAALRMLLAPTGWVERAAAFARVLRGSARSPGGLLVVGTPAPLLERVHGARRGRATILALDRGDRELGGMAHESLTVEPATAPLSFDAAQHLVSAAAGGQPGRAKGFRSRLARLLEAVSGPAAPTW